MRNFNPFASTAWAYQRVSKEYHEDNDEQSPVDARPSTLSDDVDGLIPGTAQRRSRREHACCYTLVGFISFLIGTVASQLIFRLDLEKDGNPEPYAHNSHILKDVVWERNETFQAPPSMDSEMAWMALMPKGRGFIRYPQDDPTPKGVTVFHSIHCLYNLHTAYHANAYQLARIEHQSILSAHQTSDEEPFRSTPSQGSPTDPTMLKSRRSSLEDHVNTPSSNHDRPSFSEAGAHPFIPNPYLDAKLADPSFMEFLNSGHLAHCFDYVRQSLMCAADSNLETGELREGTNGRVESHISGWGFPRVCRDFEKVKSWAEEFKDTEKGGIN